jgi:hypothetical protein
MPRCTCGEIDMNAPDWAHVLSLGKSSHYFDGNPCYLASSEPDAEDIQAVAEALAAFHDDTDNEDRLRTDPWIATSEAVLSALRERGWRL